VLTIKQLTKTYLGPNGKVQALDHVSLTIGKGEFVAVQGPSGCGKTTLLLMAGALLEPDEGWVEVDGQNPYALSAEQRARFRAAQIGFVFQQFHLVPYLSVLDNVLAPSLALQRNGARQRAEELIGLLGLSERLHHVPAELSTGERQRVALARSLLNQPKLLLADEPTGNLDAASSTAVLDQLAKFAQGGGSVLLATHDANAASRAGRIIRLKAGKLDEDGATL
jgi:putative ABC transport system ATP-binding protein